MSVAVKKQPVESVTPAVHLEFIQNQLSATEGDGLEHIEAYHRALFLHHHAPELERLQQQARLHEDRLAHVQGRLDTAQLKLSSMDKLIPVILEGEPDIRPNAPWNFWDSAMFGAGALGILALVVFGILNISFNLLESGLVTFVESPVRAYFWAALLPVGALAVKLGWDFLQIRKLRDMYLWACLAAGVAGVLVWVAAYASVYPTLSKSVAEHIQSLSVFDTGRTSNGLGATGSGAKWVDTITVAAQAIAEIFLSAVLGIYMTVLYNRHRPVRLAGNPLFTQLDEERRSLEQEVERERLGLAEARGNQVRLEHQLTALVSFAKSLFQKESALRRDQNQQKQALLDEISAQLRSQLEAVGNGRIGGTFPSQAALGRTNGK